MKKLFLFAIVSVFAASCGGGKAAWTADEEKQYTEACQTKDYRSKEKCDCLLKYFKEHGVAFKNADDKKAAEASLSLDCISIVK